MKSQPSIVVELVHISGPMKGSIQEFSDSQISIGRHPSSSVRFPAEGLNSVSRKHAEITREGNQFKLVDHSTNGTYLNGRKVTEAYLKDGDVLEFSEGGPKVSFITKVVEAADVRPQAAPLRDDLDVVREEIVPETPSRADEFQSLRGAENPLPPPMSPAPAPVMPATPPPLSPPPPPQPVLKPPEDLPTGKVTAPLVIQFGPLLRSYRELPITVGSDPSSDFVIMHPSILGRHAQIIFARGQYWIKDLTGQDKIKVNNAPISFQAALNVNDLISLAPQGPVLSFLGEGRFAEAEDPVAMAPVAPDSESVGQQEKKAAESDEPVGFWAKLKKRF